MRLLGPAEVRKLAARLGVRPSKRLGQNFVIEAGTVRRIASLAAVGPQDTVLEVGPGLGSLTLALLEAGPAQVTAVEIDAVLADELPATIAARAPAIADRAVVLTADALRVTEAELAAPTGRTPDVLVANLPYNVAVPVLLHLLATLPSVRRGLVMVQAEVAERMCAGPGSRVYGTPSVKLAWYAAARSAGTVPRSVFWPVPNVDSRLVAFTRHDPPATTASREQVFAVVDAAFRQRRKTLRAALAGWAGLAGRGRTAAPGRGRRPGAARGGARRGRLRPARGGAPSGTAYDLAIVIGVTVRVPAKLNLQLAVGPRRGDGYHDLVTVFHAVSLFDEVTVAPAGTDGIAVTGEGADRVPADGDNLALQAVAALRAVTGAAADRAGVHVTIAKRIPVAAGLAGGSADAAAALVACNELWRAGLSQAQLVEVAARVGSDVAFALLGGTAVGRGRGERLTPALAPATPYHWVLAFADGHLSTPEVYATLDRLRAAQAAEPDLNAALMSALRSGDARMLGRALSNDLQQAAVTLFPALRKTIAAGLELGALGALVGRLGTDLRVSRGERQPGA